MADDRVPTREFRDNLAGYLRRAHEGETITITRHGRPDVQVGPLTEPKETDR
jgi:prevent-host-death family protein